MNPEFLLILVASCLALNLSPGPSMLLVTSVSTGVRRNRGRINDWALRCIPGSVLIILGLGLLWEEA